MTQRKIALSIEEAADYTGIGRNTLRKLVEWKKLPVLKVGRKVLIKTDMLELFMEANEGRDLRDKGKEIILCYNSGASLTCEDSDSLEDLKSLEAEGVKILTCGTCLDFYGLKEKLAVGGITNMYEIVEIMESAGTIVRP